MQTATRLDAVPTSILVIEKDSETRSTMVQMLEALDYKAIGVENVSLAAGVISAVIVDIVLASLELGDHDGAALAAAVKTYQPQAKVVVASGKDLTGIVSLSVDAFVRKPFTLSRIDSVIKDLLTI